MSDLHGKDPWHKTERVKLRPEKPVTRIAGGILVLIIIFTVVWAVSKYHLIKHTHAGLIKNGGFEQWFYNKPVGWLAQRSIVFEVRGICHKGKRCLGIMGIGNNQGEVSQLISGIDARKTYIISAALRSNIQIDSLAGFMLHQCDQKTSVLTDSPHCIKYYKGKGLWEEYQCYITGTTCVKITFFVACGHVLLVDNVNITEIRTAEAEKHQR